MMNDVSLPTLSIIDLDKVTGGAPQPPQPPPTPDGPNWNKAAKLVGKRVLGPVGLAWSGKSVGESLWEGAKSAVW
jgi:hypothetical protein